VTPIHDQSYRRYGGERLPHGRSWIVIAAAGVRGMLARRAFLGLLLAAWIPFLIRAIQIYMAANLPQASFLAPTPQMFRDFLGQQDVFVFFITVAAGSGLIANDRRANALQIYLSKPITRWEYIFGKLAVLLGFVLVVTWVPALLLLVVQVLFAGNFTFFRQNLYLFPAITLFSFVYSLTIAFAMLALSSLSRSSRYVAILYAAVIFLSQAIYGVLYGITRDSSVAWVSVSANLSQLAAFIFRLPLPYDVPWPLSLTIILGVAGAAAAVLERRVRGVEVVA
jgi:ABC-2 type transport system permease protein